MQRAISIDMLRGMAILLMVQVHFSENLSPELNPSIWLYKTSMLFGSLAAPFFTFLSGLSYYLWVKKQESLDTEEKLINRTSLRRGCFLFVLGIAFNFFIWLPEETFNWDVLTLIGSSLLFLMVARNLPSSILSLICLMILLVSPLMRVVGDYSSYWQNNSYTYDFTVRDIIFGFVSNGYFPIFPWIIFPIMGFVSGDWIYYRRDKKSLLWVGILGLGLLALAGIGTISGPMLPLPLSRPYMNGLTEFPASTQHVLTMLGLLLMSLTICHIWLDPKRDRLQNYQLCKILNRFSSFSLTVYVFHHMVILWPLWIYGAITGQEDITHYWRDAMSTPIALSLAVLFILICYLAICLLERHPKYSLEGLLRRICG